MGLAGRKNKQRIGADPRNLTWSDDSSKFGAKYLQSLGWTSGSGLGVSGEGRTSNLKIHQKLDLMGIGANRRGADDAGWKVGRQFDGLLARLNQAQNADGQDASPDGDLEGGHASKEVKEPEANEKRKRKRSAEDEGEDEDPKEVKRRRKEEKKEKKRAEKEAKKSKKSRTNPEVIEDKQEAKVEPPSAQTTEGTVKIAPRYRAHRARNLASKRLAAASTTGMNEILGIAPSSLSEQMPGSSSIPFPVLMTPPRQHHISDDINTTNAGDREDQISAMGLGARPSIGGGLGFGGAKTDSGAKPATTSGEDLLRKNGKSVAEYLAEKMRMKTTGKVR